MSNQTIQPISQTTTLSNKKQREEQSRAPGQQYVKMSFLLLKRKGENVWGQECHVKGQTFIKVLVKYSPLEGEEIMQLFVSTAIRHPSSERYEEADNDTIFDQAQPNDLVAIYLRPEVYNSINNEMKAADVNRAILTLEECKLWVPATILIDYTLGQREVRGLSISIWNSLFGNSISLCLDPNVIDKNSIQGQNQQLVEQARSMSNSSSVDAKVSKNLKVQPLPAIHVGTEAQTDVF